MRPHRASRALRHLAPCLVAALTAFAPRVVEAHPYQPPRMYTLRRPPLEVSPWVGLGGGALVGPVDTSGVFDMRLGGDFTAAIGRKGDLRLGPFVEVATSSFASAQTVGGVELFVGAVPRPLRMFLYPGEGIFVARFGAGWTWRTERLPASQNAPVVSVTLAYGYRAPFSLREPTVESETPDPLPLARYMTGVRLWTSATVDLDAAHAWQVTGGIEFEPVGSFRYILGLY
jgi:hypothetical protein